MKIALSPTDTDWFKFLRNQPDINLVNFWTPTDWKVHNLSKGDYWYFILKGGEPRKIGGGGRFIDYQFMKASKAWELYGLGNGVSTFQQMVTWLNGYINRRATTSKPSSDPEIGCIILDNCVFLPDNQQKTSAHFGLDFPRQVVKFKTFNNQPPLQLTIPTKVVELPPVVDDGFIPSSEEDARQRTQASIVRRQGQPQFRQALLAAYEGKCAVTGCDVIDALEAAHITPYLGVQTNSLQNGILLRADIHTLFDLGKIAISSNDFRIILHSDLKNGHYSMLQGKMIFLPPKDKSAWPSREALEKHKKESGL